MTEEELAECIRSAAESLKRIADMLDELVMLAGDAVEPGGSRGDT